MSEPTNPPHLKVLARQIRAIAEQYDSRIDVSMPSRETLIKVADYLFEHAKMRAPIESYDEVKRAEEIENGVRNEVEFNDYVTKVGDYGYGGSTVYRHEADEDAIVSLVMSHVKPLLKEIADLTDAEFEPGRWWRVLAADDSLWCETSDEAEARSVMREGDRLERLWDAKPQSRWRQVRPTREERRKSR